MEIRKISLLDVDAIVELHISDMPKSINSVLGIDHLKQIYTDSISSSEYFGFVAYGSDGEILAFSGAGNSYRKLRESVRGVITFQKFIHICQLVINGNFREILRAIFATLYLSFRHHDLYISSWCARKSLEGSLASSVVFRKTLELKNDKGHIIYAEILSKNKKLLSFYKKIGFEKVFSAAGLAIMRKEVTD